MTGSNEESTTCSEPIKKKKKKQKHDDSKKNIVKELPCHNSENTKKKKRKKEANAIEDASEITEVVPKKNSKLLDEGKTLLCDPTTKADVRQKKTNLLKVFSSGDPISAEETHKKKKRKNALGSSTCDPQAHDGVPRKKKKNVAEDAASCELRSIDPVHKKKEKNNALEHNKTFDTKKRKHKKCKPAKNSSEYNEAPETGNVTEVIRKKKVSELAEQSGSHTEDQSEMSTQAKVKKKKKKKAASMNTEIIVIKDSDVHHGEESGDSLSLSQKKEVFEQEEELGSFIEEQPEMPKKAKVKKKKKKKATSMETDYIVIKDHDGHHGEENSLTVSNKKQVCELEEEVGSFMEDKSEKSDQAKVKKKKRKATSVKASDVREDPDVHCGEEGGDSLRVSKKKKNRKGSNIDAEAVHRECNLVGNSGKDSDITEGASRKKKKKAKKAKERTELMDCTDESSQVTCHEDEKKKSKGKKQKMLTHTDEERSTSKDTTEVLRKEKNSKEQTENSKETSKKQVKERSLQENIDQESGSSKGTQFGQWDTAAFQNSEQQTKFFRLMGGFKKGNQATVTSTSTKVQANMALKKEEEQDLARNLLAEFDKAVSWKENRGIGLGFQPAQKKTFYIDKTASRSVKFED
ncbi:lysine-rich nucleolar protein 1 isoform X1 [Eleutherodactylus coqui]|uniref:lysine-rich nucleolar protein 1 isoform X1 n=1 Tax=Eleutherodactylus coqui TaxID=57060 RepID=UPI003461AADF